MKQIFVDIIYLDVSMTLQASLILFAHLLVGVLVPAEVFVLPENVRVSVVSIYRCLLLFSYFQIGPNVFIIFFSDCRFSANGIFYCQIESFHPVHILSSVSLVDSSGCCVSFSVSLFTVRLLYGFYLQAFTK